MKNIKDFMKNLKKSWRLKIFIVLERDFMINRLKKLLITYEEKIFF